MESASTILLTGGLAFFLYGMHLARQGLQQAAGSRLKATLGLLTSNRFLGLGVGAGITVVLQSSSATTVMLVGFAAAGVMTLAQVMTVILGADIGTTITVQLIAFKVSDYALVLVVMGTAGTLFAKEKRTRHIAEVVLGFGLIFYGMKLMADATSPLRNDEGFRTIMGVAEERPLLALFAAAVFTAVVQSSAATIGLVLSLAQAGTVGLTAAIAAMLGANIGTCATALLGSIGTGPDGRRVAVAHLAFKVLGVILIWPFLDQFVALTEGTAIGLPRQIANAHTLFNVGISVVFLPFIGPAARALMKAIPSDDGLAARGKFGPKYLDPRSLDTPPLAIAHVTREINRMGSVVVDLVRGCIIPFQIGADGSMLDELEALDDHVDVLDREIKLYLAGISQGKMSKEQAQREMVLAAFTNDLEHIGDIVSNNIVDLGRKKQAQGLVFSSEGFAELQDFHQKVLENLELALAVFATEDEELAHMLLRHKKGIRRVEEKLKASHMDRLHRGLPETRETTSLHLDFISLLQWINSTATSVVYSVVRRDN